jgi:hypothetical protein
MKACACGLVDSSRGIAIEEADEIGAWSRAAARQGRLQANKLIERNPIDRCEAFHRLLAGTPLITLPIGQHHTADTKQVRNVLLR